MLYKNNYGEVDFWSHSSFKAMKNIGVNLSGGTDSAMLLYLLAKEQKDITIYPLTLVDIERPTNIWNAREVLLYIRDKFPDVDIKDIVSEEFSKAENPEKRYWHIKFTDRMRKEIPLDILCHGRTSNPPYEEAKKNNLLDKREIVRDHDNHEAILKGNSQLTYSPFVNVDKRFLKELYEELDIMELFNLTASCISKSSETDHFTKACRTCWWCREKLWSFGCYDYGEV